MLRSLIIPIMFVIGCGTPRSIFDEDSGPPVTAQTPTPDFDGLVTIIQVGRVLAELPLSVCSASDSACIDAMLGDFEKNARAKLGGCGSFADNTITFGDGCAFGSVHLSGAIAATVQCTVPGTDQAAGDYMLFITYSFDNVGVSMDTRTLGGRFERWEGSGHEVMYCGGVKLPASTRGQRQFHLSSTSQDIAKGQDSIGFAHSIGDWWFRQTLLTRGDCYPSSGSASKDALDIGFGDESRQSGVTAEARLPGYGTCGE